MAVPVRKIDETPLRFPKKMGYRMNNVARVIGGRDSTGALEGERIAPPNTSLTDIPRERLGPNATILKDAEVKKRWQSDRTFKLFLPLFGSFWVHVALGVLLANMRTIASEMMPDDSRFKPLEKLEVEMKLDIPKPPEPKEPEAPPKPEKPQKVAPAPQKAAPGPKVAQQPQPRPIPKAIPKMAMSAPPPPRVRPNGAPPSAPARAVSGGSPAPSNAPVAAAKALDFLSSGNPLKGLNTGAKGAFAPSAGRNFDPTRGVVNRASVGGVALGEGKGTAGAGPIRTGGKFVNGDGLGFGKTLAAGGTGVMGKVAAGQVYRPGGGGSSISGGGAVEASGPGSISQSEVTALLKRNMDKFRYCYEKSLLKDSSLAGVVKLSWTVSTSGKASGAQVVSSELNNNELHSCLMGVLTRLQFPPAKGGAVELKYPFVFRSSMY
jgi:outer membrane biosynthesis protein TonB